MLLPTLLALTGTALGQQVHPVVSLGMDVRPPATGQDVELPWLLYPQVGLALSVADVRAEANAHWPFLVVDATAGLIGLAFSDRFRAPVYDVLNVAQSPARIDMLAGSLSAAPVRAHHHQLDLGLRYDWMFSWPVVDGTDDFLSVVSVGPMVGWRFEPDGEGSWANVGVSAGNGWSQRSNSNWFGAAEARWTWMGSGQFGSYIEGQVVHQRLVFDVDHAPWLTMGSFEAGVVIHGTKR